MATNGILTIFASDCSEVETGKPNLQTRSGKRTSTAMTEAGQPNIPVGQGTQDPKVFSGAKQVVSAGPKGEPRPNCRH